MADTEARCARCGAVDQGGRWVRGGTAAGPRPARARVDPIDVPLDGPSPPAPPSPPSPRAPHRPPPAEPASSGRGCLVAAAVLVFLGVAAVVGLVIAIAVANHDGSTASSPATVAEGGWSLEAEGRFEAACTATGTDADGCRCVRRELEQRFTEDEVDAMVAVINRGDPLSASVEGQLREAERACGAG